MTSYRIHYSGIDIVFGESETPAGILIRAVERIGENSFADEYIDGPLVVLLELMNQSTSVFDSAPFQLRLVDAKEDIKGEIKSNIRKGIKDQDHRKYNFSFKST